MFKNIKNFINRIRREHYMKMSLYCEMGWNEARTTGDAESEAYWLKRLNKYNEKLNKIGNPDE